MDSQAATNAAIELVEAARAGGGQARVLGGVAVALRCPSARDGGPLARADYSDIDVITRREEGPSLSRALEGLGYTAQRRFNALHGHRRMMFDHPNGFHVDVFVDTFIMCHPLDLRERLAIDDVTVSLADLVLTKLQIAQLNAKDVSDVAAVFLDHELSADEHGINTAYITDVLGRDWGWWRTVDENARALPAHLDTRLAAPASEVVLARIRDLLASIEAAPKTMRWKLRARAGERLPWREEPEESR